jgi:uncharacterized protein DUF2336
MAAISLPASIPDPDRSMTERSSERSLQILKRVTNLLVSTADRLDETKVSVFDDVLGQLIEQVDARTLAHLSNILSEIELAPRETVRRLAFNGDASVAAPVLAKSSRLFEQDLIKIANTASQQHLLAICGRKTLDEALTDILIRRGNTAVSNALAENGRSHFSECGFATLVGKAGRDEGLAEKLGLRWDIPAMLLRELLAGVTDAVRARFLTAPRPSLQDETKGPNAVAGEQAGIVTPDPVDYTQAKNEVDALNRAAKLTDATVNRYAIRGEYTSVIAALSFKTEVKIEAIAPLMNRDRLYGLIVACRAARLSWPTTSTIIHNRPGCPAVSKQELEQGQEVFEALILSVAQWTIRFGADRIAAPAKRASPPSGTRS